MVQLQSASTNSDTSNTNPTHWQQPSCIRRAHWRLLNQQQSQTTLEYSVRRSALLLIPTILLHCSTGRVVALRLQQPYLDIHILTISYYPALLQASSYLQSHFTSSLATSCLLKLDAIATSENRVHIHTIRSCCSIPIIS